MAGAVGTLKQRLYAVLMSGAQVHPWFQPASATRCMPRHSVFAFQIFQRETENNSAGDECSHQVKAGAMQGFNYFLNFHFHPLLETINKIASRCECVGVFVSAFVSPATD